MWVVFLLWAAPHGSRAAERGIGPQVSTNVYLLLFVALASVAQLGMVYYSAASLSGGAAAWVAKLAVAGHACVVAAALWGASVSSALLNSRS